jgi:hypothetical protein
MLPIETAPNPVSSVPGESALPILADRAKDFVTARLARREPPERIAAALRALFEIEIAGDQVVACWQAQNTPPAQTERRQDKESMQFPADEEKEPLFTRVAPDETPAPMSEGTESEAAIFHPAPQAAACGAEACGAEAADTAAEAVKDARTMQTGHGQDRAPLQIPADTVDEPTARDNALEALAALAKARLGIAPDPAPATQTGRRQDQKTASILTDEVKAFIVRGLARYETPTRVAAAVKANFGIEIDRRQVFAYDPAGSRPPAQRWIDLHTATRAKFMGAMAEIGIAQKVVRLRMLDRFANRADEANQMERAAAFLAQAAKECGGFYERYQRPKAVPAGTLLRQPL